MICIKSFVCSHCNPRQQCSKSLGYFQNSSRYTKSIRVNISPLYKCLKPTQQLSGRCRTSGLTTFNSSSDQVGTFARSKRSVVPLPSLVVSVEVEDCAASRVQLEQALQAGATAVLLCSSPGGEGGDGNLFEAVVSLKDLIRGRAQLLVMNRADVAAAGGADGVILGADALPAVVARRTLQAAVESMGGVVGKLVSTLKEAEKAEKEGVDLLLLQQGALDIAREVRCLVTVPVVVQYESWEEVQGGKLTMELSRFGVDGLTFPSPKQPVDKFQEEVAEVKGILNDSSDINLTDLCFTTMDELEGEAPPVERGGAAQKPSMYSISGEDVLLEEKALMLEVAEFIESVAPDLPERELVREAGARLEEPFLMVVVGEFNAGKSSVINTLLGSRFLREGVLPTTNEISVLSHGLEERVSKQADGYYERALPADILRMVNIVDTPGTNVILERQQQLTEEFVPRADLVLFVISADRPFTESEVKFLKYIRKWEKKVVYVLNKADLLQPHEVEEVIEFVRDNSQRALGVGKSVVLPVSARAGLKAKLRLSEAAEPGRGASSLSELASLPLQLDQSLLTKDQEWMDSGFGAAEEWITSFLAGSGDSAGEAMRLKLNTPLAVATALLESCARSLEADSLAAQAEVEAAATARAQSLSFRLEMVKDSGVQQRRVGRLVEGATLRAEALIDRILRLANAGQLAAYLTGSGNNLPVFQAFSSEVIGTADEDLKDALSEHSAWLGSNCASHRSSYLDYIAARGFLPPAVEEDQEEDKARDQAPRSLAVVGTLDQGAAVTLLEEEVREAVSGTVGTASGATAVGLALTAVLPTTVEDLLALTLAGIVAYVGVLNLPLKRQDTKAKVRRAANNFKLEVETSMENEAISKIDECVDSVLEALVPWEEAARAEVETVKANEAMQRMLQESVKALQQRVRQL